MPIIYEFKTLDVEDDGTVMTVRERPAGPIQKALGAIGGFAFVAVGVFFLMVDLDAPPVLIFAFCGALIAIGLGLIYALLLRKGALQTFTLDRQARELRHGTYNADGFSVIGAMQFSQIRKISLGQQTVQHDDTGVTILYVEGETAPKNGVLMAGAIVELEELRRRVAEALQ